MKLIAVEQTCADRASDARMPKSVCPSVGVTPRGSRGLVSTGLQSTRREAVWRWTLRATLCQRMSIRASTASPEKRQPGGSAPGRAGPARRDKVPSGPLKSTDSCLEVCEIGTCAN